MAPDMSSLNNSKILLALAAIMVSIGSKHLKLDLDDDLEELLSTPWARRLIVFSLVFLSTKDVYLSGIVTLIFAIIIRGGILKRRKKKSKNMSEVANME